MEQFSTRHSALVSAAGLRRHSTLGRGTPLTLVIKLFEVTRSKKMPQTYSEVKGGTHHLKTHLKETVLGIRQRIANEIKRTNVEVIRMIDRGKELSAVMNDRTLAEINCFDGLAITVLYKKSIVSNVCLNPLFTLHPSHLHSEKKKKIGRQTRRRGVRRIRCCSSARKPKLFFFSLENVGFWISSCLRSSSPTNTWTTFSSSWSHKTNSFRACGTCSCPCQQTRIYSLDSVT